MKRNTTLFAGCKVLPLRKVGLLALLLVGSTSAIAQKSTATFSGTVFNDGTGTSDGMISGTPISTVSNASNTTTQQLYAYLVNDDDVIRSKSIVTGGNYTLTDSNLTNYSIILTIANVPVFTSAPGSFLPQNWEFVGEGNATIGDGFPSNGSIAVGTSMQTTYTNLHFAINRKPVGNDYVIRNYSPATGRFTVPDSAFTGSDPEDGVYAIGLPGRTVNLYQAVNGTLYYNNAAIAFLNAGTPVVIPNFKADSLELQPVNTNPSTGPFVTYFSFAIRDNAGTPEQSPNTVSTPYELAITLARIEAGWKGNGAEITWTTSSEIGTRAFIVERSIDGRNFTEIGRVESKSDRGMSSTDLNYSFVDASAKATGAARIYYRIQELDIQNRLAASPVRTVSQSVAAGGQFEVGPIPATSRLQVQLTAADAGNTVAFTLTDVKGAIVKSFTQPMAEGVATAGLDVSDLAPGNYVLAVRGETGFVQTRMVTVAR